MRRWLIGSGVVAIAVAVAWWLAAGRFPSERLPPGWEWKGSFVGIAAFPDPKTGLLPVEDAPSIYYRSLRIISEERPRAVRVEDSYYITDPQSGKTTWEYEPIFEIDPATGRHVDPKYGGDFLVFPRWTEKTTYRLRLNYVKGLPLTFTTEETIEGVPTYLFEYRGAAEYTESYAGTADYAGVKVAPGQVIRCVDDQFLLRIWVEPVSGIAVKWQEECLSGDAIYDTQSGARVADVLRWGGQSAGDDVVARAGQVMDERSRLLWRHQYGPASLLTVGVLLFGLGWRSKGRGR